MVAFSRVVWKGSLGTVSLGLGIWKRSLGWGCVEFEVLFLFPKVFFGAFCVGGVVVFFLGCFGNVKERPRQKHAERKNNTFGLL